jgi:hypothetical protein
MSSIFFLKKKTEQYLKDSYALHPLPSTASALGDVVAAAQPDAAQTWYQHALALCPESAVVRTKIK